MPITVVCPGCGARMTAHDAALGKSVKCPKCQTPVPVRAAPPPEDLPDDLPPRRRRPADDDEPDDRPRRKGKKRPQKSGAPVALIAGLLAVAVLAGGGFAAYWFGFRDQPQAAAPAGPTNPAGPGPAGPAAGAVAAKKAPVPDGWQVHDIEGCGFRVAFPAPPVEDAPTSQGTAAVQATGRMFRSPAGGFAASPSRVLCGVGRVTPPATIPADRRRQAGMQAFKSDSIEGLPGARVTTRRAATVGFHHPGEEVIVVLPAARPGGPVTYWDIRSAAVGNDVFVMAVWKEGEHPPAEVVNGFFDSLDVVGGAAWSNPNQGQPSLTPKAEPSGVFLPVKTVAVAEALQPGLTKFSLSADGGTVGVFGLGKKADGTGPYPMSAFYDVDTGKRGDVPLLLDGPGTIAAGGKTTAYDTSFDLFVHDIATGKKTEAAKIGRATGVYSFAPSGKLLVTAQKSKLRFQPWPAGTPAPEVDAGSPVYGLSQVFQGGTRVAAVQYDADDVVARVWDVTAGKAVKTVPLKRPRMKSDHPSEPVRVAEDGKSMVVRTEKGRETVWDLSIGERMKWWDIPSSRPPSTVVKPMVGSRILFAQQAQKSLPSGGSRDFRHVAVADLFSGGIFHFLEYPPEVEDLTLVLVECTPDGRRVASLCPATRKVYVWDVPK